MASSAYFYYEFLNTQSISFVVTITRMQCISASLQHTRQSPVFFFDICDYDVQMGVFN